MAIYQFPEKMSFEDVYKNYYDRIYKYTYTILLSREDTEDVVEDTFLSAFENYAHFDPAKASVGTWLSRIAHNKAVNLVRSAAYRTRAEMPENDACGIADPELLRLTEENELIIELYKHLTPEEREFLNMRYTMELRDAEVADILALKEKTVNKRYQRLLKKCREILSSYAQ